MTTIRSLGCVAMLFALGCAPTAEDEAMMGRMMDYEAGQAAIMEKNPTKCAQLESELKDYGAANRANHQQIDAWWSALGKSKRKKLLEKNKGSYRLAMAMMKANTCLEHIKRGMKD